MMSRQPIGLMLVNCYFTVSLVSSLHTVLSLFHTHREKKNPSSEKRNSLHNAWSTNSLGSNLVLFGDVSMNSFT